MGKNIKEINQQWEKDTLQPLLDKYPERKVDFTSTSGIQIPRVALPAENDTFSQEIGFPGQYPFTRGV